MSGAHCIKIILNGMSQTALENKRDRKRALRNSVSQRKCHRRQQDKPCLLLHNPQAHSSGFTHSNSVHSRLKRKGKLLLFLFISSGPEATQKTVTVRFYRNRVPIQRGNFHQLKDTSSFKKEITDFQTCQWAGSSLPPLKTAGDPLLTAKVLHVKSNSPLALGYLPFRT